MTRWLAVLLLVTATLVAFAPVVDTGFVDLTSAVVSESRTLTASEPATPTLDPPAPDVAFASNVFVPVSGDSASTVVEVAWSEVLLAR